MDRTFKFRYFIFKSRKSFSIRISVQALNMQFVGPTDSIIFNGKITNEYNAICWCAPRTKATLRVVMPIRNIVEKNFDFLKNLMARRELILWMFFILIKCWATFIRRSDGLFSNFLLFF